MATTKFIHAYIEGGGRATVAWKQPQESALDPEGKSRAWIQAAVAWCSPKDQFRRDKGRKISEGRMNKYQVDFWIPRSERPNGRLSIDEQVILDVVLQHDPNKLIGVPRWAKERKILIPRKVTA